MTLHSSIASSARIALLIDAENISHHKVGAILSELAKYGTPSIRRAYGNWASQGLNGWAECLHEHAIRPMQQFSYTKGKNATDFALVIDAMELLYTTRLDAFCVASSDADFTPLVMQLRAGGHEVYGFGERKTPEPFANACSTFLYLDTLGGEQSGADNEEATSSSDAPPAKPLSQDTKLVRVLRGAVEATLGEDGWAHLSEAGNAVRRQASIEPRNYGFKNFRKLFEATKLFKIERAESDGQLYIADKRTRTAARRCKAD